MSLRYGNHDQHETEPKPGALATEVNKAHVVKMLGRGYYCVCGKAHMAAKTRQEANVFQRMHVSAVIEHIENTRLGNSNYGEDE